MNANERERLQIHDAMDRLFAGEPIRSDGKLTVKSLAAEAGLDRGMLTRKHTDLQEEFRERIRIQGATPEALRALTKENADLKRDITRARLDRRRALARTQRCVRAMNALEMEKLAVEERLRPIEPRLSSVPITPSPAGT